MQTRQGLDHDGDGGLDGGVDHGLPLLDCDDGDGQHPLMLAGVSWVHLRRAGLKLDSEPHTLKTIIQLRGEMDTGHTGQVSLSFKIFVFILKLLL